MADDSSTPERSRPVVPDGYGVPTSSEGMLDWDQVQRRLIESKHYWLSTVRPDGRPHVVPRWGVWLDGRFFYDGAPTTRHARNLRHNPHVTLNLENGWEAVIVEGISDPSRAEPDGLGRRLATAFGKYHDLGYRPEPDAWSGADGGGLRVITPVSAMAWFSFPTDMTRFRF